MIVRFEDLPDLKRGMDRLPPHLRKVAILVGRHPNEGTGDLAENQHRQWEKEGGVVLPIPDSMTPPGFWKDMEEKIHLGLSDSQLSCAMKFRLDRLRSDPEITQFIADEYGIPVVNFHAVPLTPEESEKFERNGNPPARIFFLKGRRSRLFRHRLFQTPMSFRGLHDRTQHERYIRPHELVVEFAYPGMPAETETDLSVFGRAKSLGAAYLREAGKPSDRLECIHPDYLNELCYHETARRLFDAHAAKDLLAVLHFLAKKGLKST